MVCLKKLQRVSFESCKLPGWLQPQTTTTVLWIVKLPAKTCETRSSKRLLDLCKLCKTWQMMAKPAYLRHFDRESRSLPASDRNIVFLHVVSCFVSKIRRYSFSKKNTVSAASSSSSSSSWLEVAKIIAQKSCH